VHDRNLANLQRIISQNIITIMEYQRYIVGTLQKDFGFCNNNICKFLNDSKRRASTITSLPDIPHILKLHHATCKATWYMCTLCDTIRNPMLKLSIVKKHVKSHHHKTMLLNLHGTTSASSNVISVSTNTNHLPSFINDNIEQGEISTNENTVTTDHNTEINVTNDHVPEINPVRNIDSNDNNQQAVMNDPTVINETISPLTFPHCSPSQRSYFYHEYTDNDPLGYLTAKALYGNGLLKDSLSNKDIEFHITLATLCASLTYDQKMKQAKVLQLMNEMLIERNCDLFGEKSIPTCYNYEIYQRNKFNSKKFACSRVVPC